MNHSAEQVPVDPTNPTFFERWVSGTYLVSGVFPMERNKLTVQEMKSDIPLLYSSLKLNKKARWPKGICGYYVIPLYIADSFDNDVVNWVHTLHKYRWAIWHEPVLYCKVDNTAHHRNDYGLYGRNFRPDLFSILRKALTAVSNRFNFKFPDQINGLKSNHSSVSSN